MPPRRAFNGSFFYIYLGLAILARRNYRRKMGFETRRGYSVTFSRVRRADGTMVDQLESWPKCAFGDRRLLAGKASGRFEVWKRPAATPDVT